MTLLSQRRNCGGGLASGVDESGGDLDNSQWTGVYLFKVGRIMAFNKWTDLKEAGSVS